MKQSNQRKFYKIMTIFLVFIVFLTFFSKSIYNYNLPTVSLVFPASGTLDNSVEGKSTVNYSSIWNIYAEVSGRIRGVYVTSGDVVKKGQRLMSLEPNTGEELIEIIAPKEGIIVTTGVAENMFVFDTQNTILVQMAEQSKEWLLDLKLDTETVESIDRESKVSIEINGISERIQGRIVDTFSYVDASGEEGESIIISFNYVESDIAGKNAIIIINNSEDIYETILPNYALYKDSKGYYVLELQEQESVLGNYYVASRRSVDLVNSDSSFIAVHGLNHDRPIITTSSRNLDPGDRVSYEERGE